MQRTLVIATLAATLALHAGGSPRYAAAGTAGQGSSEAPERELEALEREYWKATDSLDVKTLDRLLADSFFHTDIVGDVATKPEMLDFMKQGGEGASMTSLKLEDLRVRVYGGDTAVLTFWLDVGATIKKTGQSVRNRMRVTSVWVKEQGRWQRVAEHYSRPAGDPNASAPATPPGP